MKIFDLFNAWLLKIFTKGKETRKQIGYLEAWVSIMGNVALAFFKFVAGIFLNSLSLIADAWHSLSDVLTSVIVLVGFKVGEKPPDKEHPFGHGRFELLATFLIALLLGIVAYDLGKSAIFRIIKPEHVEFNLIILIVLILSALFKEWLAHFSIFLGRRINSSSLIADAWHHRSDAIATLFVAVGLIFSKFGIYRVDGILALGVALLIVWVAVQLLISSSNSLIGVAPDPNLINKIHDAAFTVPGVTNIHEIYVHDYVTNKIISLHVEVKDDLTVDEAHNIANSVEEAVQKATGAYNVTVHIDPLGRTRKEEENKS
ncbi:MAG: cation diffusion facilitator family transporter [Caldisericum sp.]